VISILLHHAPHGFQITDEESCMNASVSTSHVAKKAEDLADPLIERAVDRVQSIASQAIDSMTSATKQVRATVTDVSDGVVSYTQDNPFKAILISAAVGALAATVVSALIPSRR